MTNPKEKAEELINKYLLLVPKEFGGMDINLAKQCALILVEELINVTGSKYWYEVKREIILYDKNRNTKRNN